MRTLKFITLFIILSFINSAQSKLIEPGYDLNEANIHYTGYEYIDLSSTPQISIKNDVFCLLTIEKHDFSKLVYGFKLKRGYAWVLNKRKHIEKVEFRSSTSQLSIEQVLENETLFIEKLKNEVPLCETLR